MYPCPIRMRAQSFQNFSRKAILKLQDQLSQHDRCKNLNQRHLRYARRFKSTNQRIATKQTSLCGAGLWFWTTNSRDTYIAPSTSYLVEVNGCTYRRNRVHLRDAVQSQTGSLPVQAPDLAQTPGLPESKRANNDHDPASNQPLLRKVPATSMSSNTPPASSNLTQTRSRWIVKPNNLFKDFVQWEI